MKVLAKKFPHVLVGAPFFRGGRGPDPERPVGHLGNGASPGVGRHLDADNPVGHIEPAWMSRKQRMSSRRFSSGGVSKIMGRPASPGCVMKERRPIRPIFP